MAITTLVKKIANFPPFNVLTPISPDAFASLCITKQASYLI